jgi:hypothetical protein
MIDKNKQYKTRDGREVRIYATDGGGIYPVHGAIKNESGWYLAQWYSDGRHIRSNESPSDLIEVKPRIKIERWIVVYENGEVNTLKTPPVPADYGRFAVKHISFEVEEGEGLNAV